MRVKAGRAAPSGASDASEISPCDHACTGMAGGAISLKAAGSTPEVAALGAAAPKTEAAGATAEAA
eukprot:9493296-Pyramimonas_sp.AAC.1